MIDYGLFMMIYKPSKLICSSVHIDRVYHFILDHFSRIPLYTYISFNGPDFVFLLLLQSIMSKQTLIRANFLGAKINTKAKLLASTIIMF